MKLLFVSYILDEKNHDFVITEDSEVVKEDVMENPYYETKEQLMQGNRSNPKSEVVDLNDTETVKVTKNIYYDI